jgi:rubrerythrin
LQTAFAGEIKRAENTCICGEGRQDGQPQVAKLFRAASDAETVHARNHLNAMKGIGTVADNLKAAVNGEQYEFSQMYPGFITQSQAEKATEAETSFTWANKVEKIHYGLYQQALSNLQAGKSLERNLSMSARPAVIR